MIELNGRTQRAKNLIWNAEHFTGYDLSHIYNSWSDAKQRAYEWCRQQFVDTDNSYGFRVGNANTFGFCASWFGTIDGEPILRYETKDNSYLVWLNR